MRNENRINQEFDAAVDILQKTEITGTIEISNNVYLYSGTTLLAEQKLCGGANQPSTEYYALIKREKERRDQQEYLNQDFNNSKLWIKKVEFIEIGSAQDLVDYLVEANNLSDCMHTKM